MSVCGFCQRQKFPYDQPGLGDKEICDVSEGDKVRDLLKMNLIIVYYNEN